MNLIKNLHVGTRLIAGFLFLSILGAIVGGIGIANMGKINDRTNDIYEKELMGVSYIKEANIDLVYVGRSVRSMLLAASREQRKTFIDKIGSDMQLMKKNLEQARPLVTSASGKETFSRLDKALADFEGLIPEVIKRSETEEVENRDSVQFTIDKLLPKANVADDLMSALSELKQKNAAEASSQATALYQSSRLFMIILVVGSLGAGLALGVLLTRSITGPLAEAVAVARTVAEGDLTAHIEVRSGDETGQLMQALRHMNDSLAKVVGEVRSGTDTIATASRQIAAGNLDLSSRTEEQASSLEETASSMEELTSTVKQNADNARQANQLAGSASDIAAEGGRVVGQVVNTMASINESSKKIVEIIGVIDGIAFQTNILALNAAVEAARAGEQGRGFAVVASEVRNLAQRSAAAAREIKTLIGDSVEKVDAGARLVDQAGATMDEIVESVKRVTDIMSEISAATQEQTMGIEQINQAIAQMDQVTQQNASLVEEAAAASEAMQEQAGALAMSVSVFKLADKHALPAAAPAARPRAATVAMKSAPALIGARSRRAAPAVAGGDWEQF